MSVGIPQAAPRGQGLETQMVNHPNRSKAAKESVAFCDWLFNEQTSSAIRYKLNGCCAGFDKDKKEIFIQRDAGKNSWMPAGSFLSNLSAEEIELLSNLPNYNGSNGYELNSALLRAAELAIRRYLQQEIPSSDETGDFDYHAQAPAFTERIENGEVKRSNVFYGV